MMKLGRVCGGPLGALAMVLGLGCGGEDAKPEKAAALTPAAPAVVGQPAEGTSPAMTGAPAKGAVTIPEQQSYPIGAIKPVADNCQSAHVILATAPSSVGVDYPWTYSKQAMLANQQFKVVAGSASTPGQVSFATHQADRTMNEAYALVARCGDGSTCNHLAAMYKAVVKSSNPQVLCGKLPPALGQPRKQVDLLAGGPEANVPRAGDVIGMCARIAACTIATDPSTTEDVGIQCQKQPAKFKTQCASSYPCAEVMACLAR